MYNNRVILGGRAHLRITYDRRTHTTDVSSNSFTELQTLINDNLCVTSMKQTAQQSVALIDDCFLANC